MIPLTEKHILNSILLELPKLGVTAFRANSGESWVSSDVTDLPDGSKLLRNPRRFRSLVPGFSDIFGLTSDGRFIAIEVKTSTGRVSDKQENFLRVIRENGGIAGVARSVEDARKIIESRET